MSRNKENKPLPSQTRVNGSVFGVSRLAPSSDFFTDSILEDTSRIPSPSPQKHALSKTRRAIPTHRPLQVSRDSANTANRSSSPHNGKSQSIRHLQPAPPLKRPSPRSSQQELITPPQSRDGPDLRSPTSDVSSPPRGLTDVYQRIHDEEALADAGRESGSSDEEEMVMQQDEESPSKSRKSSSQRSLVSKGSTPLAPVRDADKENRMDEQTGSLSEASGYSFLQQLTDRNAAAAATPHFSDRAKDLRRVQSISSKPIIFNQGPKPSEMAEDARSTTSSDRGSTSSRRVAFRHAGTAKIDGIDQNHSEPIGRSHSYNAPFKLALEPPPVNVRMDDFEDGDTADELLAAEKEVQNRKLKRLLGGPRRASPQTSHAGPQIPVRKSLEKADDDEDVRLEDVTQESQLSNQSEQPRPNLPEKNPVPATAKGFLSMWSRKANEHRGQRQPDSSQIDWASRGAVVPLPSVEDCSTPQATPPKHEIPASVRSQKSVDRLRRLDNDFTGMSFQVSESPPVRSRKNVEDYVRDREMDHLNKQALTTNQLAAIREKDPREAHRRLSRSPNGGQLRTKPSLDSISSSQAAQPIGERVPDTPVVVHRSSSNSSRDGQRDLPSAKHDRSTSFDQMQRLARAMSNTPKSSPAPTPFKEEQLQEEANNEHDATKETCASSANAPNVESEISKRPSIAATPKVIGAWTDTILPDTIRTARQAGKQPSRYAQTPHVNAGGWIDTPAPVGQRQSSALAPMTIEEETEELTTDVVPRAPPKTEVATVDAEPAEIGSTSPPAATKKKMPPSVLGQVLEDNTFDFGETTMDSLGNLLDDTTKMLDDREAILLQAQGETATADDELRLIDHLRGKLNSMVVGIHDTRKGISSLEREFMRVSSEPPLSSSHANAQGGYESSLMPMIHSTITLPIPLLFHPQPLVKGQKHRTPFGRPTLLGYITIGVWIWYLSECLATELFSHPLHAERYVWPSHDTPEPAFPFVLPTLVVRCLGWNLNFSTADGLLFTMFNPLFVLLRALYRIVGMGFGWTDGFVDDGASRAIRNATSATLQGVKAAVASGLGDDWSMMNDEIM